MKKLLSIVLAVLMVASCAVVVSSCNGSKALFEKNPEGDVVVKIGGIGPLTGDYASYGNSVKNGAQIAVDMLILIPLKVLEDIIMMVL